MKHTFLMTGLTVAMLSFLFVGCNSMKKLEKEVIRTAVIGDVTPQQLESVNGKIPFQYNVAFGDRQFPKKMTLKVTPKMQYGNSVEKLAPIYFQGEKVKSTNYPVVAYKGETVFNQQMVINYKPGMENGVLWAEIEAMAGDKAFGMEPVILNQNGVKVWQQHVYKIDGVNYVPLFSESFLLNNVPDTEVGVISGYILFPLAESVITEAQMKSAAMKQAADAMKQVLADRNATVVNMALYASSSPEGAERLNKNLTKHRLSAATKFFEKDLGLTNSPLLKNPKFLTTQMVDENWDGLYMLLSTSTVKNKTEIINEIKAAANNNKREAILESYIKKIPELKDVILPILRRADFFIFYTVPGTMDEEIDVNCLIPQADLPMPAVSTHGNWQLLNDLAVVAIQNGDYGKALKLLEAAIVMKQDATLLNNLGVIYANQGSNAKAIEMLSNAQIKNEAKYNMGLILLQQGEYAKAVRYLQAMPDINLAYAQLLANDNHAALKTFKSLTLTTGMQYYMEAVAAARTKDVSTMAMALKKAVQLNPKLKQWAASDIEFYPYAKESVFMEIIK